MSAWRRNVRPWKRSQLAPKQLVTTQLATQTSPPGKFVRCKLLEKLVDLVGIEPTTSSMPWKRAPSCATGPREGKNARRGSRACYLIVAQPIALVKCRSRRHKSGLSNQVTAFLVNRSC